MNLNLIIKNDRLKFYLVRQNNLCLFISFFNMNNSDTFEFRIILKLKKIYFVKLNAKHVNNLLKSTLQNNVVLNNKNIDLVSNNISLGVLNNFFMFFYFLNYLSKLNFGQINLLYIKLSNFFFNIYFFNISFKKFLINNFKELSFAEFKNFIDYSSLMQVNVLKILYFKMYLYFKIFLFFKISNDIFLKIF
jgi:hypothetical protein